MLKIPEVCLNVTREFVMKFITQYFLFVYFLLSSAAHAMEEWKPINICGYDGDENNSITVPAEYIQYSKTLMNFQEDFHNFDNSTSMFFDDYSNDILNHVVACLKIIHEYEPDINNINNTNVLASYLDNLNAKECCMLMCAANFLDIHYLLPACAQRWGITVMEAYENDPRQLDVIQYNNKLPLELKRLCAQQSPYFFDIVQWVCNQQPVNAKTLYNNTAQVMSLAFSRDNNYIAIGSFDIEIWDITSGNCFKKLIRNKSNPNKIISLAFSLDGKYLAASSYESVIEIWDIESGICITTFEEKIDAPSSLVFSPNGKYLLCDGCNNNVIHIFDVTLGKRLNILTNHTGSVSAFLTLTFSPDGNYMASGSYDKTIKIWDVTSNFECIKTLKGHTKAIDKLIYSPDGKYIASSSYDNTIRIWCALSGKCVKTRSLCTQHTTCHHEVLFGPDSKNIIFLSLCDTTITIWDVMLDKDIKFFLNEATLRTPVIFSPDGNYIVSDSWDKAIKNFNLSNFWNLYKDSKNITIEQLYLLTVIKKQQSVPWSGDKDLSEIYQKLAPKIILALEQGK